MGRPRKRKLLEREAEDVSDKSNAAQQAGNSTESQEFPEGLQNLPDLTDFGFGLLDQDFRAFDYARLEEEFLLEDGFFIDQNNPLAQSCVPVETSLSEHVLLDATEKYAKEFRETSIRMGNATLKGDGKEVVWHFGYDAFQQDINFNGIESEESASANPSPSNSTPPNATLPQSTTTPATTNESPSLPPLPQPTFPTPEPEPCNCLNSLYLALASLQILSTDTTAAISTIRQAAYTARTVLACEACSVCAITPSTLPPPMRTMQNAMLLGTLLPVITDGYKRLLNRIDEQCTAALLAGRKILFSPLSYGGYNTIVAAECDLKLCMWEREVEPLDWRSGVRCMLRGDIYGYGGEFGGLKGLIKEVEARQRKRHDEVDALVKAGLCPPPWPRHSQHDIALENRPCERILDVARHALADLVIA